MSLTACRRSVNDKTVVVIIFITQILSTPYIGIHKKKEITDISGKGKGLKSHQFPRHKYVPGMRLTFKIQLK